jgi:hypothetical protein
MIRKGRKYSLEEILPFAKQSAGNKKERMELDGDFIKLTSDRLFVFKQDHHCCKCGIAGKFFVKEKGSDKETSFHLNMYAIDEDGSELLMTKDHKTPRSLGGKNHPSNYQTMCVRCNLEKGNGIQRGTYLSSGKMGENPRRKKGEAQRGLETPEN